jgi:hypothetical protein
LALIASLAPEILEAPRWLSGPTALCFSSIEFGFDLGNEPVILRQTENVMDIMDLAPSHELVSAKAAVGAQHNAHFWPSPANLGNDAGHLLSLVCASFADTVGTSASMGIDC